MVDRAFVRALENLRQIQITTVGRTTGAQISLPVWFVQQDDSLYLLPVRGSDTNWYKNVRKAGTIRMAAGGAAYTSPATAVTDPAKVEEVVRAFRAKYGDRDVKSYYPHPDVAVGIPEA